MREGSRFRKSLRNRNINYRNGWFFVTTQVAHNKCVLGAISGGRCLLTPLGEAVRDEWLALPAKHPELELDAFVVMPNHFHAIVRIHFRPTNKEHHLGYLMSRFKGKTGYIYGKMKSGMKPAAPIRPAAPISKGGALAPDIGKHLWQFDYWDDLITSADELENQRRYIRENPERWSRDRFGPCTEYAYGNIDLLAAPRIAFVASQGFPAGGLRPRKFCGLKPAAPIQPTPTGSAASVSEGGALAPAIISTFTSAQEREALRRALAKRRRVIAVYPQGIPPETELLPELLAACRNGFALLLSPQPPGSRLNKKTATWCNEYVLAHANEIWTGDIAEGGMLHALLKTV
ncbi:MAG: hypothetical protein J6334_11150 [Kiritimatiellae bacterium]|nr:hypothetical protein [Kiritimatiellia bacterium]